MTIKILNPIDVPDWNRQISKFSDATIFHTSNWAKVLSESYGYRPIYFTAFESNRLTGCIPIMEVDSLITGRRGVSLPFTDVCQPFGDACCIDELWNIARGYAAEVGWKNIELRGDHAICNSKHFSSFVTHQIDLSQAERELYKQFRGSTKRNIKKAKNSNVLIRTSQSLEAVDEFYRLNCITRKRHGLPPQPKRFFEKIGQYILNTELGFVITALFNEKAIAAAIFFKFNSTVFYKYAASDIAFQNLRASNLIIWHAIERNMRQGLGQFHFGRTEPGDKGLLQFKRGWGASEKELHYFEYSLKENNFIQKDGKIKSSYTIFKKMPMPLLKLSGRILYKHVG